MLFRLVALFILLPLIELALLIQVGRWMGLAGTIAIVVGTGLLGAALARRQGLRAWLAIQRELADGRMPASALVDGLLILIGAVVLLTPGLITDLFGFLMLVPASRRGFRRYFARRLERAARRGDTRITFLFRP